MESFQMIAKTFQGLEEVLAQELTALGAEALLAHQTLAAQFQKNSFKLCHFILIYNLQLTVYRA